MTVSKFLILIIVFLNTFFSVHSQENIPFKSSHIKNKSDLKFAKNEIKKGDEFFYNARNALYKLENTFDFFEKALYHYFLAYKINQNNVELNFKIGEALFHTSRMHDANFYLTKAVSSSDELEDYEFYLDALKSKLDNDYDDCIKKLKSLKTKLKKKDYENFKKIFKKLIRECESAIEKEKNEQQVWVDNLGINSSADEIASCISLYEDELIFSSNMQNENLSDEFNRYDFDIYSVDLKKNKKIAVSISSLNSLNNDLSGSLYYDGSKFLYSKFNNDNFDIYESFRKDNNWTVGKRKMGDELRGPNTENDEFFTSYDPPEVKVYFITNGGYSGNKDIYFSGVKNKERNIWGGAQSAGIEINTNYDEGSVYIHPDGKTMYFSSKGHDSMGGYDIFVSEIDELGQWGKPVNLGYPINTIYDDNYFVMTADGRTAYFSSNRPSSKGGYDIYKMKYKGDKKLMLSQSEDKLFSEIKPIASLKKKNVAKESLKLLTIFRGKVLDKVSFKPVEAEIKIVDNSSENNYNTLKTNRLDGSFLVALPSGKNYGISIESKNYLFHSENFDLPKDSGFNIVEKEIYLKNISVGNNIILSNVFFDLDKYNLKKTSFTELDRLFNLLVEFKDLKIEISGHTDNLGSEVYNELLSQKRADAVKNYLIGKGINEQRIISIGYGQTLPVSSNSDELGRSQNRRTEFKIIK